MNAITDVVGSAPAHASLALRKVGLREALAQTRLSRVIDPLLLQAQGVQIMIGLDAPRPAVNGLPWLHFTLDGNPGAVQLPWGVGRRLAGVPVESSDGGDAALLIEAGIAAWLDEAEAGLGLSFRLEKIDTNLPEYPVATTLNIKGKERSGSFLEMRQALTLSAPAAEALGEALTARCVIRDDLPGLQLRLFWERDCMPMTHAELAGLRPGDALALNEFGPCERVSLEGQSTATAQLKEQCDGLIRLQLLSPFHATSTFEENHIMSDATQEIEPTTAPEAAEVALDDIDVQLTFRAGEAALPLSKLKTMGPGSIIEMTDPANATVSIMANGRVVGSGELIDVAGRRAVQIRRLFAGS